MSANAKKVTKRDLRHFSCIWSIVFLFIALYPYLLGEKMKAWALTFCLLFMLIGMLFPDLVAFFYKIWISFGNFAGKTSTGIVLFLIFTLIFTPLAIIARAAGRDLLKKTIDRKTPTYWENRDVQPGTMKNQF